MLRRVLSILMPVYNERARVAQAIAAVLAADLPEPIELIVIDDGSHDGTREILRGLPADERVRLGEHTTNRGKGAAIRTALAAARGEFAAIFDADLEYSPDDLGRLLEPLLDGESRACFGARAFDGATSHSFLYVMGNRGVTLACNVLFNVYLRDIMTCQKVIRTDLFRELGLRAEGFAIEAEITARLLQKGERIVEVPVRYRARTDAEGKKLTPRDGVRTLGMLLRRRLEGGFGSG